MAIKKYSEKRPWGGFERFTENEQSTVKIISVNPNEELSLQFHRKREEFWRVVGGSGTVTIGEKVIQAKMGDEFSVGREEKHRMASGPNGMTILEIATGDFDENDIVRIEDKYNRITNN